MSRQLVITADDVGVDEATISAVADLVPQGRLSAVSIIPMAAWALRALEVLTSFQHAGTRGDLVPSIGLHATFTTDPDDTLWGPSSGGPSLTRPGSEVFHADVADFAAAADPTEVLAELRAQIRWFRDAGVSPTHLDSHDGAVYGLRGRHFLHAAIEVCAEHGLALRLPRTVPTHLGALSPTVRLMHRAAVAVADDLAVRLPETIATEWRPLATLAGYDDLRDSYLTMLRNLPEGLSEVFLHPLVEPAPGSAPVREQLKRVWELRLLEDDLLGSTLDAEGIEVVSWPSARIAATGGPMAG